jgi:Flp pilus assembly pilin Flp
MPAQIPGVTNTPVDDTRVDDSLFVGTISYNTARPSTRTAARTRARRAAATDLPRRYRRLVVDERGAATAEYAIATMAAVGFAGLLVVIMRSDEIRGILTDLIRNALTFGG